MPAAAPNSGRAGGRGPGGEGTRSGPSALRRGPGGEGGRGPSEPRGRGDRRTLRQRRGFGRPADAAVAGFVIVDSVPSSAEHAGSRRAGEGRPGGAEGRRAGPEVGGLPGKGRSPPAGAVLS